MIASQTAGSLQPSSHVLVRGLTLDAEIGVHAHEHGRRQPLVVEVELALQTLAFLADDLGQTVDYERIAAHARALAGNHIRLVETFAERLARACLEEPGVQAVRVLVEKPEAIPGATAGVEIVRTR